MTRTASLLACLQLSDSAFPSGFYTMSHGLEGFSQAGLVARDSVGDLLRGVLRHAVGPADGTALARAHDAVRAGDWDQVVTVDSMLHASKLNSEMRKASVRSGHQLTDVALEAFGGPDLERWSGLVTSKQTPGCQPVAAAVVHASTGVGAEEAVVADMSAFAVSFLGAALRLRLTDHRHVQVVLRSVADDIAEAAAAAVERDLDDLGGFVPMADVVSAQHERAPARLFAS